jgi:DNA-binding transcriptional ArsR family regulator
MAQTYKDQAEATAACCGGLEGLIDPELFRALGDPNRVALLVRLGQSGRPTTVTEAAECCPVDLSVVSRHLAVLREAGVLRSSKQGREVHYTVSRDLAASLRALADALDACCPPDDSAAPSPDPQEGTP